LRDPVRLFAKKQAQKVKKKLPRLIASVSVVDQIVTRYFFMNYAEAESDFYPLLPTKKGIGFNREHAQKIGESVEKVSDIFDENPIASDVSGWEKNFSQELADLHADHMIDTCENADSCGSLLVNACEWWSKSLLTTPYVLDSGEIINFDDLRVQRSGDYLTTSSNGVGRGICAEYVGSYGMEMGDDCLEWPVFDSEGQRISTEELIRRYAEIGLPVRDVEFQSKDDFVFCSHRFKRQDDGSWHCWLDSWQRMLYEASFSKFCDESTIANYLSEVEDMPPSSEKSKILFFLGTREMLLRPVAEHDKNKEKQKQGEHSGLKTECVGPSQGKDAAQ
jgi:hypothetical protein